MPYSYQTIAQLCKSHGFTVTGLCRLAGVSPGILSDLKTGRKKSLSADTVAKLAAALGVSADAILGTMPPTPEDELIAFYGTVKDYLDENDRSELMAFMRMKAEIKQHDKKRNDSTAAE